MIDSMVTPIMAKYFDLEKKEKMELARTPYVLYISESTDCETV